MTLPDLETLLRGHRCAEQLIKTATDVEFFQDTLEIPDTDRADNFTVGTLATRSCFALRPAVAVSLSQKVIVAAYYLGPGFTGHKGFTHGGAIATILDECCGRAALCHFNSPESKGVCFAGSMTVAWFFT